MDSLKRVAATGSQHMLGRAWGHRENTSRAGQFVLQGEKISHLPGCLQIEGGAAGEECSGNGADGAGHRSYLCTD